MAADASLLERIDGSGTCIVVDPIDGTHNYVSGLALFGMIVAVVEAGETRLGLLYDPIGDDAVVAVRGGGTWLACATGEVRRFARAPAVRPSEAVRLRPPAPDGPRAPASRGRAAGRVRADRDAVVLVPRVPHARARPRRLLHRGCARGLGTTPPAYSRFRRRAGSRCARTASRTGPGGTTVSVITAVSDDLLARVRDDFDVLRPEPSPVTGTA